MILSKLPCPDCNATGIDKLRGGLCTGCNGEGKRRETAGEEKTRIDLSGVCACAGGTASCNAGCG